MRGIPPGGAIPPGARRRATSARRRKRSSDSAQPPHTIKTWTFEEKPSFKRLRTRLRVRRMHQPEVNVHDKAAQLVVVADLPGVKGEDIEVDIHGDIMTIEATRTEGSGRVRHYHRELLLPAGVHEVPIDLAFNDGLLEVRLKPNTAKREPARPDDGMGRQ